MLPSSEDGCRGLCRWWLQHTVAGQHCPVTQSANFSVLFGLFVKVSAKRKRAVEDSAFTKNTVLCKSLEPLLISLKEPDFSCKRQLGKSYF